MALEIDDINIGGTLSATTVSATTIVYGGQPIQNVFVQNNDTGGFLPISGGTVTGRTVFNSGLSGNSISATTYYGDGSNLTGISGGSATTVRPGSNITTGGTVSAPIISVVSSPIFNGLTLSGTGNVNLFSATTLSGNTIFSGSTNLYNIFQTIGSQDQDPYLPLSGGTVTGDTVFAQNLTASTISANRLNLVGPLTSVDGAIFVNLSADTLTMEEINIPTNPVSAATLFVRNKASRRMAGQVGPSGIDYTFQPSLYGNKIALWNPPGNATTVPGVLGMAALTATGTATLRNVATTNLFTRTKRLSVVSAAAAGSLCGYRLSVAQYSVGNGSGLGGFMYVIRFGVSDAQTATRMFVGLRNTTAAPTNIEPSTITNCIGIGNGAANTNLFIYYGGSVAQTPINLGANFPCNTNSTDLYELTLFSPPNSNNTVGYRVERLNTGDVATGTLTGVAGTALPSSTTLLTLNDYRTNNASGGAVSLDYVSIYVETDY